MLRILPRSRRRSPAALFAVLMAAVLAPALAHATAPGNFQGMQVEVVGKGLPVLMIPGLNSGADSWRDTCQALQPQVQCHLVTLPGFAGQPAVDDAAFLTGMRDRLLAYIADRKLAAPVVAGHSLGGMLALQMALKQPQAVGKLVIVDSLPYFGAAQNPAATPDTMRPMAEQMRAGMLKVDQASYLQQAEASVNGMAHEPARIATLKAWSRSSDRTATANAMYEMMVTDLRGELGAISAPTLVLGSWAAYKPYGATQESTRGIFASQYARLDGVRIEMSQAGYHFLMWDDPQWLQAQMRDFLALPASAKAGS
ncbi:alpha/beta hydrolase [Stenotrophomonas sp. YIM B06876]|uniref:alpha/beta fold hydrolase n=1 Tax=Stenotrophomonas sp. YIM B06876 TaxID=3060211 RepID=UPI00273A0197|nr:alpha/beta hydrolase [Stenotrophomonas sp. YIM B06876]